MRHLAEIAGSPNDSAMSNESSHSQPAYVRAQEAVLEMIEKGALTPGDQIPSERTLSDQLALSRMTVRKAVDNLVRLGTLERRSTKGTHVASPRIFRPLDSVTAISMSEIIRGSGAQPGSRLLFFEQTTASRKTADDLAILPGAPVLTITRLRTANGVPFCVETSTMPAARVPGLVAADLIEQPSLYALLQERYGIRVGDRRYRISVAPIEAGDAKLLDLEPASSILRLESVVSDQGAKPIEQLVSINHPQRVAFSTHSALSRIAS